jgi:hypothetical protein
VVLPPSVMLPPVAYPSMDRLWRRMGDVPLMGEARPSP